MWRLALGLQQRSKFLRESASSPEWPTCCCCFQAVRVPAPTFTACLPQLPRFVHTLLCSQLTASAGCLHVWAVCNRVQACASQAASRPTINSCPITFDFHFRHSLLGHNQPSRLFHPPSPGHITLHQPHYGSRARAHGCPEEAPERRSVEEESV